MAKDTFLLNAKHYSAFRNRLSTEQKGHLLDAIYCRHLGEDYTQHLTDDVVEMVFSFMADFFDICDRKYQERVEKNRANANKRYEKQAKASNSMQSDANGCNRIESDANTADTDTDTEFDIDTDSDIVSVSDTDSDKDSMTLREIEEREIFKKFFFKNFLNPQKETERYLDWGDSTGWVNKSGQPINNKVAYAGFWKPEEEGERFPLVAIRIMLEAYNRARGKCEDAVFYFTKAEDVNGELTFWGEYDAAPIREIVVQAAEGFGISVRVRIRKERRYDTDNH